MSLAAPPPPVWALDVARQASPATSAPVPRATGTTDIEQVSSAWKHVRNVIREDAKPADLFDLLSHSVRETQYSFQPQGWPSLLRPLSPILNEMPAMVLERYAACQTVAFCGVFPEIRRAWASVDNSLFLWRFDKWQDVPLEYSGEEQSICAVGLVRPRQGVFVEAIQHLLVLCTTTEIVLLGVCCAPGPHGEPAAQVSLRPLPLYSVPADNVTMVTVAGSAEGRIFLGGADGNLYELLYSTGEGWRSKRCSKVCHTGGIRQLLPAFVPTFLFGAPSALVDLVVDDARHILYARTQTSGIQVFDLGSSGTDAPHKVAETASFLLEASNALGGRDVFGRGSGDKGASVVYMAPIPPADSQRLHLLTVTADGRRVFWSTIPARYGVPPDSIRPDRLRAEVARQAMPTSAGAPGRGGGAAQGQRGLEVVAAHYARGALLLACAGAGAGEGRTRLFMLSRDLSIPPVGTATGAHVAVAGLREAVTELDMVVPGDACTVKSVSLSRGLLLGAASESGTALAGPLAELSAQNMAPPPRFVAVTTAGVLELEKLRPVDVLAQLLEDRAAAKLEQFFKSYGPAEAAAMCILLATSAPPTTPAAVVQAAKQALDNPRLCGEPAVREVEAGTAQQGAGFDDGTAATGGGFDMGAAVPVAEPDWSGAHKGLCLYLARLLQGVWEEPVVSQARSGAGMLSCRIPTSTLQVLEDRLRALDAFLGDFLQRRRSARRDDGAGAGTGASTPAGSMLSMPLAKRQRLEDAVQLELKRTAAVRALAARTAEACFLLRVLVEHNLGRLAARCEDSWRAALRTLRFREWAAGEGGEGVAAQLVSVLLTEHLSATGGVAEDLSAALQGGCPSFFREDDKLYYRASGLLQRAEGAPALADREAFAREAVSLMMRVPLAVDLGQVVPQLAYLRDFEAVVELPLKKAAALDPHNVALAGAGAAAEEARSKRLDSCYQHVMAVLRFLVDPSAGARGEGAAAGLDRGLSEADRKLYKRTLLRRAAASDDRLFHETLYGTLIDLGAVRDLLELDTPYLERYLLTAGGLAGAQAGAQIGPLNLNQAAHVEVLARYYISRQSYANAARVYELLAERRSGPGEAAVSLDQRMQAYQEAVLQAKSQGDAELLDGLEGKERVLGLQQRLVDALEGAASRLEEGGDEAAREEVGGVVAELRSGPQELVELYNDVAVPYQLWGLCLEMVNLSNYGDPAYVRQLWDIYLKQAWEGGWSRAQGGGDGEGEGGDEEGDSLRAEAALDDCCRHAEDLGGQFYPSENSLPASHVLLRLEQAAAGTWPQRTGLPLETERVVRAMVRICAGSYEAVVRTYETLLSVRGGDPNGEELHAPFLRLRLLRSLFLAVQAAAERLADGGAMAGPALVASSRRELGALFMACEAYAAEARRLMPQDDAEQLAGDFLELQRRTQPLVQQAGYTRGLFA